MAGVVTPRRTQTNILRRFEWVQAKRNMLPCKRGCNVATTVATLQPLLQPRLQPGFEPISNFGGSRTMLQEVRVAG